MAARSLRSLALAMSAVGTLVLTQGCVDDGVSLHAICPLAPTVEGDTCTYDPMAGLCVHEGILNLFHAGQYSMSLRMESGLKARGRDVPPQGEPNGLQIRTAHVELRLPNGQVLDFSQILGADGQPIQNPFEVAASGYIPPGGQAAVTFTAVTSEHAAQLTKANPDKTSAARVIARYPQIVVAVKIKGKTAGQVDVESGEYVWPIRLDVKSDMLSDAQCQKTGYCLGSLGQDNFAFTCGSE